LSKKSNIVVRVVESIL